MGYIPSCEEGEPEIFFVCLVLVFICLFVVVFQYNPRLSVSVMCC